METRDTKRRATREDKRYKETSSTLRQKVKKLHKETRETKRLTVDGDRRHRKTMSQKT